MNSVPSKRSQLIYQITKKTTLLLISTMFVLVWSQQAEIKVEPDVSKAVVEEETGPEFKAIPVQIIDEGAKFNDLNISQYFVNAPEDVKNFMISISGSSEIMVTVNGNKTIKAHIPNKEWNGSEMVTITAVDPNGKQASTTVEYVVQSVNDIPVMKKISDQIINEGGTFTAIALDAHIKDVDHNVEEIVWSYSVDSKEPKRDGSLYVTIDSKRTAVITAPDAEWYGGANITFTATDPDGGTVSQTAQFIVKSVNDKPVIKDIPSQKINEGEMFTELLLSDFITDVDHQFDQLKISVKGNRELKASISNGALIVTTSGEQFNSRPETLILTVEDPENGRAIANVVYEVQSVNDAPEMKELPSFTIEEGQTFAPLDLSQYVIDIDHKINQLKWDVKGNKDIAVKIFGGKASFDLPNKDWNGEEYITIRVTDPDGAFAEGTLSLTVTSINDLPELKKIMDQKIKEGQKFKEIKLDDYITDADHKNEEIMWSYEITKVGKSYQDLDLDMIIDNNRIAKIIVPDTNFHGAAKITITAEDPEGATVKTNVTYTVESVNDKPLVRKIPDQSIDEGSEFMDLSLDDFIVDSDHEPEFIKWSVNGDKKLNVVIDSVTRSAVVKIPNEEFNCAPEKITFTATDPEGAKASATVVFEVRSINDAPEFTEIPGQTINEGESFSKIDLGQHLKDIDNTFAEFKWEFSGFKGLQARLIGTNLTIEIPNKDWNGEEYLSIKAIDPSGAIAEAQVIFVVTSINDIPVLKNIQDQKIKEGSSFKKIELDKYVNDDDHKKSVLMWTTETKKLDGSLDGDLTVVVGFDRIVTIKTPNENWHGKAEITFLVEDLEGGKATTKALFEVTSVNDKPVLSKLKNQEVNEGETFFSINLRDFVKDADHEFDSLKWSVRGGKKLKMSVTDGIASVEIPDAEWNGPKETFNITVTDPEKGRAFTKVSFKVNSINDAPVMKEIPIQNIKEGESFTAFSLKELVEDVDHAFNILSIDISGNKAIDIKNYGGKISLKTPHKDWHGSEVVTFKVTDPDGASVSKTTTFTVLSVNDIPEIKNIRGQKIKEGEKFNTILLDKIVSDDDHKREELFWVAEVKDKGLSVIIDGSRVATIQIPDINWHGKTEVTFTVTDPEGGTANVTIPMEVQSINDKPVLKEIADQTIDEGGTFTAINLDDFISDADHVDSKLKWEFRGQKDLNVSIDKKKRILVVKTPNKDWNGKETITLRVTDPEGAKVDAKVVFTVNSINDIPVLSNFPEMKIKEGGRFKQIDLKSKVKDDDHVFNKLKWTISGAKDLKVKVRGSKFSIETPNKDWNGSEVITATVRDPEGGEASQTFTCTVISINDIPELKPFKDQVIKEGDEFRLITLDDFVIDADHDKAKLEWSWSFSNAVNKSKKKTNNKESELISPIVVIDANRVLKLTVPDENWHGERVLTLVVTDPEGGKAQARFAVNVTSVNDIPVMKKIEDAAVKEGDTFKTYDLNSLITDVDHSDAKIRWTFKGTRSLKVKVDKKNIATVAIPNKNWHGKENITFTATDPEGGVAKQRVEFEVISVNDEPVLKAIPSQSIKEGSSFKEVELDKYVSDADHKDSNLKWSHSGNKGLKVRLSGRKLRVETPNKDWHGKETLLLTVTDPEGAKKSTQVTYTVTSINDKPVVKSLSDQTIKEGDSFKIIPLDEYVKDDDHNVSEIKWSYSILEKSDKTLKKKKSKKLEPGITVSINENREAIIKTLDENWHGSYDIVFTAEDPEKAKASMRASFTVTSVNDIPVLKQIPDQKIAEGMTFTNIQLSDYVQDADHSFKTLKWNIKGNKKLKTIYSSKKGTVLVKAPNKNWHGKERLTFTVTDREGGKAKIMVQFEVESVNDAPVFSNVQSQTINEGSNFKKINLSSYVKDVDHKDSQLKWTIEGNKDLKINMVGPRLAVSAPDKNWHGKETLTFTATDPDGASAKATTTFTIKSVNDKPELKGLRDQKIKEGESFKEIVLDQYVTDEDHLKDQLKWSYTINKTYDKSKKKKKKKKSKPEISVSISENRVATIKTPHEDWHGEYEIVFTVTDPAKAKASMKALYSVTSVNDVPVLQAISDQSVAEGEKFTMISLDNFVTDADHSKKSLAWTFTGARKLKVRFNKKKRTVTIGIPNKDWYGKEQITFEVKDAEGGRAKRTALFEVRSVNDKPVIKKSPSQTVKEGKPFKKIDLGALVTDVDHKDSQLKWKFTGYKELKLQMFGSKLAISTPNKDWNGKETIVFTVTDPDGATASKEALFVVKSVNDKPVFKKINGQKIKEGGTFKAIDLTKYLSDADHDFSKLKLIVNEDSKKKKKKRVYHELSIQIDKNGLAKVEIPNENWNGKETHTITAIDPENAKAQVSLTFGVTAVNDKPEVFGIADQTINEGSSFKSIVLNDHVEDVDDKKSKIKWTIRGNKKLKVTQKKGKVTISTPSKTWYGPTEKIIFTATDPQGGRSSKTVNFTVNRVNHAPVISKIKPQTIKEGGKFKVINLDSYVKDRDDNDNRLFWFIEGKGELLTDIDYKRRLTVTAPNENWFGKETITLTCQDSEGAKSSRKVTFTVKSVNDAPRALSDNYSTDEGKRLKVSRRDGVLSNDSDADGPKPTYAKLVKKPKNGRLRFKKDGSFTYTPKKGFSGDDSFQYKTKDRKGKYSAVANVSITVYFKLQDIRK